MTCGVMGEGIVIDLSPIKALPWSTWWTKILHLTDLRTRNDHGWDVEVHSIVSGDWPDILLCIVRWLSVLVHNL